MLVLTFKALTVKPGMGRSSWGCLLKPWASSPHHLWGSMAEEQAALEA